MPCLFWYCRHKLKNLSKQHLTYIKKIRLLKIWGKILKYSQWSKNKFSGYLFTHATMCKGPYSRLYEDTEGGIGEDLCLCVT